MTNEQIFKDFLDYLLENAAQSRQIKELEEQSKEADKILDDNFNKEQIKIINKCISMLDEVHDRQTEILYRQGIEDGIWILKTLKAI